MISGREILSATGIGGWLVVGIAVVGAFFALAVIWYLVRRMALDKGSVPIEGLTLEQIDRLRSQGVLTDGEYRLARRAVLGLTASRNPDRDGQADEEGT